MRPVIRALVLAAALVATAARERDRHAARTPFSSPGNRPFWAPAASARPRARAADPGAGRGIGFPVRDRVVHGSASRPRAAALQGYGGVRRAGTGTILITMSGYYTPDESVLQSWADFFGGLIHGSELNRLKVYLASPAEITGLCGAGSDACYYDDRATLYMPGDALSGGNSTEAVVAHEYGHHVATFRNNSPWRAVDFGPKYWATYEDVC